MQFCAYLAVNSGRQVSKGKMPRTDMFRTMPNCHDCMEDQMHMVLECKEYTHIRRDPKYSGLFDPVSAGGLKRFCNHNVQTDVAVFISDTISFRNLTLIKAKQARVRRVRFCIWISVDIIVSLLLGFVLTAPLP